MTSSSPIVLYERTGRIARITLNRPDRLNAINNEMPDELAAAVQRAKDHYKTDLRVSIAALREALKIDPLHAVTWYELGKCHEALGERDAARRAFIEARENDICPLRILSPMEAALEEIAAETGLPLHYLPHL